MGWNPSKEQRRSRRIGASLPLRYTVASAAATAKAVSALTSTVAYSGLSFVTPVSLPVQTRLHLEISIPGVESDLVVEAVVVRIAAQLPSGEGFEYGVEFTHPVSGDILEKYICSVDVAPLLQLMGERGASALHLTAFAPPVLRVRQELLPEGKTPLTPERLEELIFGVLPPERKRQLKRDKELDLPLAIPEIGRWRANIHYARGLVEAVFRSVNTYIPTLNELGLPNAVHNLALSDGGLILVTGPTGSGKTTTLAAIIGHINREARKIIITIEDPVEYVHDSDRSIVKQREVGTDTHTPLHGLKHALRQNPDVILVSEVRDAQTMDLALRAAESGLLVLTTMHTADTVDALERVAAFYPREDRGAVLHSLAAALRGVIAQRLFHTPSGSAVAVEALVAHEGIRSAIRGDKLDQIYNHMLTAPGSILMDNSLRNLVVRGLITYEAAALVARDPERLKKMLSERHA